MNIAIMISSLNAGGAERVISSLANYWASTGHKVSLITLSHLNAQPFYPLNNQVKLFNLDKSGSEPSFFVRVKNIFSRIFAIRKTIAELKPDVIVSFMDVMNITTLISSWGLNIPVVISERIDPTCHKIPPFYAWLRFKVYPFCHRLIVQTKGAANYFPLSFQKFICIIPNAVEVPKNQKESASTIKKMVAVGRLEPQKDHETLIRAFSNISHDYPELTLSIYGEGTERPKLEHLIQTLALQKKVFLCGIVHDVHQILMDADLFVHPSRYEGFPNAVCEAMAVGLPVIVSNCTGNIDVVREGVDGRLFSVGDVDELMKVIVELLGDLSQQAYLAKNAREVCERFHADNIFGLWDRVINSN